MTPTDVSMILAAVSVFLTALLGGFAFWQAREYAREARESTNRMSDIQREIAITSKALESNVNTLSSILGTQIDRLTEHISKVSPSFTEILQLFKATSVSSPAAQLPSTPYEDDTSSADDLVTLAKYTGWLNIFVRQLCDRLDEARLKGGMPPSSADEADAFEVILTDSYVAFHAAVQRLEDFDPAVLDRTDAAHMLEMFRKNYIPHVVKRRSDHANFQSAKST